MRLGDCLAKLFMHVDCKETRHPGAVTTIVVMSLPYIWLPTFCRHQQTSIYLSCAAVRVYICNCIIDCQRCIIHSTLNKVTLVAISATHILLQKNTVQMGSFYFMFQKVIYVCQLDYLIHIKLPDIFLLRNVDKPILNQGRIYQTNLLLN